MIIGLNGNAFAGKDTVGAYLVQHYQFERVAFADKLKEAAAALLRIPVDQVDELKADKDAYVVVMGLREFTFRHFLQRMGTEMGRNVFGENFWVDQVFVDPASYYHAEQKYAGRNIVVTDCRFDNEAQRIKDLGGYIVRVEANKTVRDARGANPDAHVSEDGIHLSYIDYVIHNNGTRWDLYNGIEDMINKLVEVNSGSS